MPKKKKLKRQRKPKPLAIERAWPSAISLRSHAVGWCTVLMDESYLQEFRNAEFNPLEVVRRRSPRNQWDGMRRKAGRGKWLAMQSHPEITDADGVPGLDLVVRSRKLKVLGEPPEPEGNWCDRVTQFLDLPTGRLIVAYEEEFFSGETPEPFEVEWGQAVEGLGREFLDAGAFNLQVPSGFYQADMFTRFLDPHVEEPSSSGLPADLVIFLTPTEKPTRFRMAPAIQPFAPSDQNSESKRRKLRGMPERGFRVTPNIDQEGVYRATVSQRMGVSCLDLPTGFRKQLGVKVGSVLQIEVQGKIVDGVVTRHKTPDPSLWDDIEKAKRKAKNYAVFRFGKDQLIIDVIKRSRSEPFEVADGTSENASLQVVCDKQGRPVQWLPGRRANNPRDWVLLPSRPSEPAAAFEQALPMIEQCFGWTQAILFDRDGKTYVGAAVGYPPLSGTGVNGEYKMAGEAMATISEIRDGMAGKETTKKFRGWPGGLKRALKWVAQQAKGSSLCTKRYEIELDFFDRRRTVKKKDAMQAAIAIWQETLGITDH